MVSDEKVFSTIVGKEGKTYRRLIGHAFVQLDGAIVVYLDCMPLNGKLTIAATEEESALATAEEERL